MRTFPVLTLVLTLMSIAAAFAPKSGEELRAAVDAYAYAFAEEPYFPRVEIDTGLFQFVLIRATSRAGKNFLLVRGRAGPSFTRPNQVADPVTDDLEKAGYKYAVMSGGEMEHDPEKKTIKIYGTRLCDVSAEVSPCFQKLKYMHIDDKTV